VARDRKRAKQRQQRRTRQGAPASTRAEVHRADLPGALEHASGEVDEFDAALVRGAGGVPVAPEELPDTPPRPGREGQDEDGANGALSEADLLQADAGSGRGGADGNGADTALLPADDGAEAAAAAVPRERRQSLPRRAIGFLRASWAELQRVQWPDRRQVSQATAVVLGFVAVAGAYLGAADWVATKIVNFIL
jgi:preprotein translocase subunit SecE